MSSIQKFCNGSLLLKPLLKVMRKRKWESWRYSQSQRLLAPMCFIMREIDNTESVQMAILLHELKIQGEAQHKIMKQVKTAQDARFFIWHNFLVLNTRRVITILMKLAEKTHTQINRNYRRAVYDELESVAQDFSYHSIDYESLKETDRNFENLFDEVEKL